MNKLQTSFPGEFMDSYRIVVHNKHNNSRIVFTDIFRTKYLIQPFMDFDFWNLTSSGDVVYKERWWR
jgi:hypothetical protein